MKHKSVNFPVNLKGQWQSPDDNILALISKGLAGWLLDEGSLTARLKSRCEHFEVQVIGEQKQICSKAESCNLIKVGEPILVREVILYCDGIAQVFARSLLPLSSLTGNEQALANLGTQPLGQVLFNNPSLQRNRLELSSFGKHSSVSTLAQILSDEALVRENQFLWGRRSIFMLENKPLMVAEVFLPDAFAYQA